MPTVEQWKAIGASAFRNFFTSFLGALIGVSVLTAFAPVAGQVAAPVVAAAAAGASAVIKVLYNWFDSSYTEYGRGAGDSGAA